MRCNPEDIAQIDYLGVSLNAPQSIRARTFAK